MSKARRDRQISGNSESNDRTVCRITSQIVDQKIPQLVIELSLSHKSQHDRINIPDILTEASKLFQGRLDGVTPIQVNTRNQGFGRSARILIGKLGGVTSHISQYKNQGSGKSTRTLTGKRGGIRPCVSKCRNQRFGRSVTIFVREIPISKDYNT